MLFLSCQQCREADRFAIEELGVSSLTLMENAGRGCADAIFELNITGEVVVFCGSGNNGGDGFVIARHLHAKGKKVKVVLLGNCQKVSGDARTNLKRLDTIDLLVTELPADSDVHQIRDLIPNNDGDPPRGIVDAMLGTGATGGLRAPYDHVVNVCNATEATRIAVDLPSGLDGDTGQVNNDAFMADLTCTFIAAKHGMITDTGRRYCGDVKLIDIGIPEQALTKVADGG